MSDIILDACMPISRKMCEKFCFLRTDTFFGHDATDSKLLEESCKEDRIIATRDFGFIVDALSKGIDICVYTREGHLWHLSGKAELIERHFKQKYHDMITYQIHETDRIVLP